VNALKAFWLAYLSQPASDRAIYRAIRRRKFRRIMEIGLGDGGRALRMIGLARRYWGADEIRYVGVDLFEAGSAEAGPNLTLKQAHRLLRRTGVRSHLVPGDPFQALARTANSLAGNELVLISMREAAESLERAWFYLPRMLAPEALVLVARPGDGSGEKEPVWQPVSRDEILALAAAASRRRAA